MVSMTLAGYYYSWLGVYISPMATGANLFGWHWIWSVSEKEEKHWQSRSIPIGKVTAAILQEKGMTLILLSEITLTAKDDSINISFNLDFYLQLTAEGSKSPDRRRQTEVKWKTKECRKIEYLELFLEHLRLHETKTYMFELWIAIFFAFVLFFCQWWCD